jgi:membrane-associated protease RseP (regulator of RpoE activity)
VTRRRANPRIEAMVHMGGIMVLGVVMILVTLRDCGVLFS